MLRSLLPARRHAFRVQVRFILLLVMFAMAVTLVTLLSGYNNHTPPINGLVYCSEASPEGFNPQLAASSATMDATSKQLFNRLLTLDSQGNIMPSLATEWQISDDKMHYRFSLREGVAFHHTPYFTPTRLFNAKDVVFSFERILDTAHPYHAVSGGRYSFFSSTAFEQLVRSVNAIDDRTIEFELMRPDSSFLSTLASDAAVIHSAEYGEQLARQRQHFLLDTHPIGTGPFKFKEYVKDSYIKYDRHEHYWAEPVQLDRLVFDITPNATFRMIKLVTGECDVVALPSAIELHSIRQNPELFAQMQTGFNVAFLAFNAMKPPLDDVRVRKAITYAIDRETIMEAVYYGTGMIADALLPPTSWAHDDQLPKVYLDREKAKALLAEAGLSRGFDLELWVPGIQRDYNPNPIKAAQLIQSDLAKIGIRVRLVTYDWHYFLSQLDQSAHEMVLLGWTADTADPDNFFSPLISCSALAFGSNRSQWCDYEIDQWLNQAVLSTDRERRKTYYRLIQSRLAAEVPVFPIAHGLRYIAMQTHVEGVEQPAFGALSFAKARRK